MFYKLIYRIGSGRMLREIRLSGIIIGIGLLVAPVFSRKTHRVGQKNKMFTVEELRVQVGDIVSFPNFDPFFHNIYSLSPAKIFDLGSYPQGRTRKVKFDQPGKVEIHCGIHPDMFMTIYVEN